MTQPRIGIIGAGPSGLASAQALRDRGYSDITIIEKRDRPGGQTMTQQLVTPDNRTITYELGSLQPPGSKYLHKLFKRYGMHQYLRKTPGVDKPLVYHIWSIEEKRELYNFTKYKLGIPLSKIFEVMGDMNKLFYYIFRYRRLHKPGFDGFKYFEETSVTVDEWVSQRNFKVMADFIRFLLGSPESFANARMRPELPVIKGIKILMQLLNFPLTYINGGFHPMIEGYQTLWTRLARNFNIEYEIEITNISRQNNTVTIVCDEGKSFEFDKVIISCAPNFLNDKIDYTDIEKLLFKEILFKPGWRAAFLGKGIPTDAVYTFIDPSLKIEYCDNINTVVPEGHYQGDTWLFSAIFSYEKPDGFNEVAKRSEKFIKDWFGGSIEKWLNQVYWPEYGIHFSCNAIKNYYPDKFEEIQGENNTYYVGNLISGGTNATVTDYAFTMVKKHFPLMKE